MITFECGLGSPVNPRNWNVRNYLYLLSTNETTPNTTLSSCIGLSGFAA